MPWRAGNGSGPLDLSLAGSRPPRSPRPRAATEYPEAARTGCLVRGARPRIVLLGHGMASKCVASYGTALGTPWLVARHRGDALLLRAVTRPKPAPRPHARSRDQAVALLGTFGQVDFPLLRTRSFQLRTRGRSEEGPVDPVLKQPNARGQISRRDSSRSRSRSTRRMTSVEIRPSFRMRTIAARWASITSCIKRW
jgi:hypothetical protein